MSEQHQILPQPPGRPGIEPMLHNPSRLRAAVAMNWLCRLGLHRWMTVYAITPRCIGIRCTRCGKETERRTAD